MVERSRRSLVSPLAYAAALVAALLIGIGATYHWSGRELTKGGETDDTKHFVFERLDGLCSERFGPSYRYASSQCCDKNQPPSCQPL
jgi:hypothetical protein